MLRPLDTKISLFADSDTTTPPASSGTTQQSTTSAANASTRGSENTSSGSSNTSSTGSSNQLTGNRAKMKNALNKLIETSYKGGSSGDEVIDIIQEYPWSADSIITTGAGTDYTYSSQIVKADQSISASQVSYKQNTNIPYCYLVERKLAINGTIQNLFNLLNTFNDTLNSAGSTFINGAEAAGYDLSDIKEGYESIKAAGVSSTAKMKSWISKWLPGFTNTLICNNLNDEMFNPYRFMYVTAPTGKKYVFPFSNIDINTSAKWGDRKDEIPDFLRNVLDLGESVAKGMTAAVNFTSNLINAIIGKEAVDTYVSEKVKTYSYPSQGDSVNVNFTLYNTTKKNAWKNNFKFIYLFACRSLPFRVETTTYVPPCLYDIIIPGVKHLPVCAMDSFKATPRGMIRTLKMSNFLSGIGSNAPSEILVNVPEAWDVSIKFNSLIAPSANLMLANYVGSLGIEAFFTQMGEKLPENEANSTEKTQS